MNNWTTLLFILIHLTGTTQIEKGTFEFSTNLHGSFYHIGSYSKERPAFYLEQELNYYVSNELSLGIQTGINLYPGLLGFPVSITAHKENYTTARTLIFTQSIGRNFGIGELFFSNYRYWGSMGIVLNEAKKMRFIPELGYSLLWDRYGGGALSFFAGVRLSY